MIRRTHMVGAAVLAVGLAPAAAAAQQTQAQQQQPPPKPLEVGTVAPDFTLPGATRYGALEKPVHLSDFKGKTVVLAFFIKARTKG